MDVRRQTVRFIERTDANEANSVTASGVVAPNCDPAPRAAGDLLTLATIGRRVDDLNFSLEQLHPIGFNQGVQGKGGSGFSLTPAAMAAMDEQRLRRHAITHEAASAATVEERGFDAHCYILLTNLTVK